MNYREAWANGDIEAGTLVDRIEGQEREIERLRRSAQTNWNEFAEGMKAQPSGVVLPARAISFSGDEWDTQLAEAYNDALDAVARLNQSASAGDERAAFDTWFARDVWNEGCHGNPDILKRQLWPCWQARAALSANHSEQVRQMVPDFERYQKLRAIGGQSFTNTATGERLKGKNYDQAVDQIELRNPVEEE